MKETTYQNYKHYLLKTKKKDCVETYEEYLRETDSGSSRDWMIKAMAKTTYAMRFCPSAYETK